MRAPPSIRRCGDPSLEVFTSSSKRVAASLETDEVRSQRCADALETDEVRSQRCADALEAPEVPSQRPADMREVPEVRSQRCTDALEAPEVPSQRCTDALEAPEVPSQHATVQTWPFITFLSADLPPRTPPSFNLSKPLRTDLTPRPAVGLQRAYFRAVFLVLVAAFFGAGFSTRGHGYHSIRFAPTNSITPALISLPSVNIFTTPSSFM